MAEPRKRRASKQLSPYDDRVEEESAEGRNEVPKDFSRSEANEVPKNFRRARARREGDVENTENLKGIFGKSAVRAIGRKSEDGEERKSDVVAGINRSFLKAVQTVLDKQSNKNLVYLFKQYEVFVEEAKKKEKI